MSARHDPQVRLFDRLIGEGFIAEEAGGVIREGIFPFVDVMPPRFIVDDASDYYFRNYWATGSVPDPEKEFLCVRPPFDMCWFEARCPTVIAKKDGTLIPWREFWPNGPTMYGISLICRPIEETRGETEPDFNWVDATWLIDAFVYLYLPVGETRKLAGLLLGEFMFAARADGTLTHFIDDTGQETHWAWTSVEPDDSRDKHRARAALMFVEATLLALTFMACVNVSEREYRPMVDAPKLAKAYQRRHGVSLTEFKVLTLAPHDHAEPGVGHSGSGSGSGKRLHVVRGHFRRMPEIGPGGRYHYTKRLFWVRPHMRGQVALGEVMKDYRVTPGDFASKGEGSQ